MKRDLYLISEAYKHTSEKWMLVVELRNKPNLNDYYTFSPLKDATEEQMAMTKNLVKMPDRTGKHGRVKTSSKYIEVDKKKDLHTMVVMHVGPKQALQDMLDQYKQIHANVLHAKLIPRVPMKPATRKHFGEVIQGLSESKKVKIPNEYVLFFGIYSKQFSNRYAEGKLIKYSDLTEHERGLIKMMNKYATTGDFKAYEMKARAYAKYTAFVAFVGSEEAIRDIAKSYQKDYGSDFDFEERKPIPMQKKTKKHFGDIMAGLKESKQEPELYALILHLNNKKDQKDYYFIKKLEDLNKEEKEILENEEGKTTSFKQGVHKYREYFPDQKTSHYYQFGRRVLMYVAPLNVVERELEYYKLAYGKKLEPGITVKSKTKETFGNILGGLNESKTDLIPLDMDIINVEVDETGWVGDVREITYTIRLNVQKIKDAFVDIKVVEFEHKRGEEKTIYSFKDVGDFKYMGSHDDAFRTGFKWYNSDYKHIIKAIEKEKMVRQLKPKTQEHFADILKGLNESRLKNYDDHVLMQWLKYDKNNYKSGVYEIKPVKRMTEQDWSQLRKMTRMHAYMHGYQMENVDGYDEMLWIFGTKKELQEDVEETKKYMMGFFRERIPMKPKTKKSFADIFDKLNEQKEGKVLWVLIIKFQRLKTSKYNDSFKYVISPLNKLSKKNRDIYNRATNWIQPAYNKKVELSIGPDIGGVDMGNYKAEVFRGPEHVIKGELISHERVFKMEEEVPVPMKPKTEKHFGHIVS